MNDKPIYHSTSSAIYYDNGDGSLTVVRKSSKINVKRTVATFKNDNQGHSAYRNFRKNHVVNKGERIYTLYRCPINGTYDSTTQKSWMMGRRGNIRKKDAKVLSVLQTAI